MRKGLNLDTPGMARSILWLLCVAAGVISSACRNTDEPAGPEQVPGPVNTEASTIMNSMWNTSAMIADKDARTEYYNTLQQWADQCPSDMVFLKYLNADAQTASALELSYPVLKCYDLAFDRIIEALKSKLPSGAKPRVWALYNMGVVVQTQSGNYAVDVYHRRGSELAPYLDFYAVTHIHADHKWESLAVSMSDLGKPVLSNFAIQGVNNSQYLSMVNKDYTIGGFNIHSFITHHNSSPITTLAVTAFYVDGGDIAILHSGDSNFIADEFETMRGRDVDFYIFRYAVNALTENNVLGNVVKPKVAVLSHILELGHKDIANSRWSLDLALDRAKRLNCETVAMPFWGDCMMME